MSEHVCIACGEWGMPPPRIIRGQFLHDACGPKRIAELEANLKASDQGKEDLRERYGKRIAELEAQDTCDACGGTGRPISGKPCMCGGSGRASDAVDALRSENQRLRGAYLDVMSTFREDRDTKIAGHRVEKWHALARELDPKWSE